MIGILVSILKISGILHVTRLECSNNGVCCFLIELKRQMLEDSFNWNSYTETEVVEIEKFSVLSIFLRAKHTSQMAEFSENCAHQLPKTFVDHPNLIKAELSRTFFGALPSIFGVVGNVCDFRNIRSSVTNQDTGRTFFRKFFEKPRVLTI